MNMHEGSGRASSTRVSAVGRLLVLPLLLAVCLFAFLTVARVPSARSALRLSKPKVSKCVRAARHSQVLRVGTFRGKAGPCATIQEAIDDSPPGGWILIAPGDYKEASSRHASGGKGDDTAPASILVTTPGLHIRGMNRNTVVIDGTKPGSPQCSSAEGDQTFGPETENGPEGNNGIEVYKASGVYLQNLTVCNFLNGSNGGGDALWFDGGGATGHQNIGSWWGEYLNATSTYWGGKSKPSMEYGIYASNTTGPGYFVNDYANNSSDSAYYIGACPDCNTTLDKVTGENSDLGYSGSNSGGRLIVKNSLFQNNEEGFATQSQNNDDAPSPQDGSCPNGEENPNPPAGAQRKNICWEFSDNRVLNNSNGKTPVHPSAPGLVGTGMSIAGGRNDLVTGNTFSGNKAWGILLVPYPGVEEMPPEQIPAEDNCKGGVKAGADCLYEAFANEIYGNTFSNNGGYGNPSNADIGEVDNAEPQRLTNCWHGNVEEGGGEPTSEPKLIQTTHGTCSKPDAGGESTASVLTAQAACDSQLLVECPSTPGEEYPRYPSEITMLPVPSQETMPDPCLGVPRNPWCKRK
jgi:hypothetical protein